MINNKHTSNKIYCELIFMCQNFKFITLTYKLNAKETDASRMKLTNIYGFYTTY